MTQNILIKVERTDLHLVENAEEHPTLHNIEHAIEYVTIVGDIGITCAAYQN